MSKGLLITGATGKQGRATIDALLSSPAISSDYTILAVTRNPASESAQALASRAENIKLVKGDLDDAPDLFKAARAVNPNIWGVFSVQVAIGKGHTPIIEQSQGKSLVDEALKNGVKQFVYTSVERGGQKSFDNPTLVPHFLSKHNIEHHLVEKTKGTEMRYTILRPVAFMEGWEPGFAGKLFGAMWMSALPPNCKLQLVSTIDIGHFAAQAFLEPEQYKDRALSLAGDELTFAEASKIFEQKTGSPMPTTYTFLGTSLLWFVKELGIMFSWFRHEGFGANILELKKEHPGLMSLGGWIEQNADFVKK